MSETNTQPLSFSDALKILDNATTEAFTTSVWIPSLKRNVSIKEISAKQQKKLLQSALDSSIAKSTFAKTFYQIIKENCLEENIFSTFNSETPLIELYNNKNIRELVIFIIEQIDNFLSTATRRYNTINIFKNDNDLFSENATLTNSLINPTNATQVINSNSQNCGLLHFQNAYLNEYSFNVSLGNIPVVNQSYVADNIVFYTSGSGVKYSILDLKSGLNQIQNDTIIIPKSLNYNQSAISGQNILLPTNANVSFYTNNTTGVLFYTDTIQSLDYSLSFNRKPYRAINYKFPLLRKIEFPINGKLNTSFIVEEDLVGSFFDTLNRDDDYNIVVDFSNSIKGVDKTKFTFSGCKFTNINYDSSIGSNKTATLSFDFDLDPDFARRGLFVSGNVLYGVLNNTKKVLIF
jgi:hypothetical protein